MMFKTTLGALLATTLLTGAAFAQASGSAPGGGGAGSTPSPQGTTAGTAPAGGQAAAEADAPGDEQDGEDVDISVPGGPASDIVVIGRRIPNTVRVSREVVSVLSQADIARTGEGDIAGALSRVTGLSVVGGRFVYVRGLGERYSLALLNGLPIPSPDPLRRVVPLDIFPTSILSSSLVQKSYSPNFPGEFGGGVINITTRNIPDKPFLSVGGSIGANTATTGQLGYVHSGGSYDWTGFDDGTRRVPSGIRRAQGAGQLLAIGPNFNLRQLQDITIQLRNAETNLIFRNNEIPVNWGANFQAGTTLDVGDIRFGAIATVGFSSNWQTKAGLQQLAGGLTPVAGGDPILVPDRDFDFASTEMRTVFNALLGLGAEFGEHKVRFTNLYINDALKETRLQVGIDNINVGTGQLQQREATAFFRRQLIDTQAVGELRFGQLSLDLRGTYANTKRLAPYERFNNYVLTTQFGINDFVNDLRSPGQSSLVAFSRLNEDVYGAGADLGYKYEDGPFPIRVVGGYAFNQNLRISNRFDYRYQSQSSLPISVAQLRPDFLLSDSVVQNFGIFLNTVSSVAPVYRASLTVHAGYGQIELQPFTGVQFVAGVRYESGEQVVDPQDVFNVDPAGNVRTVIKRDYWLPAATLTWNFAEDMQVRLSASKTIARPQFREQAPQTYFDTESDRLAFGNQFLTDSELFNVEARYEWYFGRDQRFAVGAFYKDIDRPIESIAFDQGGTFFNTFANAPAARLYGAEVEALKYFALGERFGSFFTTRRALVSANYTYTQSELKVGGGDTTRFPFTGQERPATDLFRNGIPLTGQSDHVFNIQLGLQDTENLSEQTLLFNYASDRVTFRGPSQQPDFTERPGLRMDVVLRQGIRLAGLTFELKAEARNLTNTRYQEFQSLNGSRIDNNTFALGRTFSLGAALNF